MDFNLNFQLFENSIEFLNIQTTFLFIILYHKMMKKSILFINQLYLDFQIELSNS